MTNQLESEQLAYDYVVSRFRQMSEAAAHAMRVRVQVLIVDDQAVFRQAARATFELMDGFEVCAEAENGERALELIPIAQPDLVLMDIHVPGLDGFLSTRRLREVAVCEHRPIIILLST